MPVLIIKTFTSKFCCAQFWCLTSLQANGLQVVWCGELLDLSGSLNGFSAVLCWGCCWAVFFCWACGEFGPYGPQTRIKNSLVVCILCPPKFTKQSRCTVYQPRTGHLWRQFYYIFDQLFSQWLYGSFSMLGNKADEFMTYITCQTAMVDYSYFDFRSSFCLDQKMSGLLFS